MEHSGIHLHNGLSEILAPVCGMHKGPPEVPAVADEQLDGITMLTIDRTPFHWPEKVEQAIERYTCSLSNLWCGVDYSLIY